MQEHLSKKTNEKQFWGRGEDRWHLGSVCLVLGNLKKQMKNSFEEIMKKIWWKIMKNLWKW